MSRRVMNRTCARAIARLSVKGLICKLTCMYSRGSEAIRKYKHTRKDKSLEHQKAVSLSKKDNSALLDNMCQTNHTIAWDNSKIITSKIHKFLQTRVALYYESLRYTFRATLKFERHSNFLNITMTFIY